MAVTAFKRQPLPVTEAGLRALLHPGQRIYIQGGVGQPRGLIAMLARAAEGIEDLEYISVLTPGLNTLPIGPEAARTRLATFFDFRDLRRSFSAGRIDFTAMHYSQIASSIRAGRRIDIALIQVAPPDHAGRCSLGICADFVPDLLSAFDYVVAEINTACPAVADGPFIPIDVIDYFLDSHLPLIESKLATSDDRTKQIARNVAELVQDGDTIQFGVGRLPQAAVEALGERNDLGLHNGLTSQTVRDLVESGVINGRRKSIDRGRHVTGAVCGERAFYDWAARHPQFAFRPVSYTHALSTLAAIDNLVAINAALEVDLLGQANSEMAGHRQISGSGGLVDFMRGARASNRGRAIICVPATSRGGTRSNIVPSLKSVVTVGRTDIDIVATEYGVAHLRDLPVEHRAAQLIEIAAPPFREELRRAWKASWSGANR